MKRNDVIKYCEVCSSAWITIDKSEKNKKYICTMCEENDNSKKSDSFNTIIDAGN